jgi:hypothetical protein
MVLGVVGTKKKTMTSPARSDLTTTEEDTTIAGGLTSRS